MANLATIADQRRSRIERATRKMLRREFTRYALAASQTPKQLTMPTFAHAERLAAIIAAAYEASILLGIDLAEEQLSKASMSQLVYLVKVQILRLTDGIKRVVSDSLVDQLIAEWVEVRSFQKAKSIAASSRAVAQTALDQSIAAGLGEAETARAIRGAVDGLSRSKSLTIARTETHSAMMNASVAGADSLGAGTKIWVPIEDDRTRITHLEANGQSVPLKGLFLIGDAQLSYPGDPDAGAPGETINCRCALQFGE
jgi:Phage Mu protein F like protein